MFATLRYLLFLPSKIALWTLFQRNSNKLGKSLGQLILWFLFGYLDSVVLAHRARKTLIQQCGAFLALSSLPECDNFFRHEKLADLAFLVAGALDSEEPVPPPHVQNVNWEAHFFREYFEIRVLPEKIDLHLVSVELLLLWLLWPVFVGAAVR